MNLLKLFKTLRHEQEKARARNENPPRYIVSTIADMADIPADRFPAFLEEMTEAVTVIRGLKYKNPGSMVCDGTKLIWIDDSMGKKAVSVNGIALLEGWY